MRFSSFFYFALLISIAQMKINLDLETFESTMDIYPPISSLWSHAKNLSSNPQNLTELKICLMKSYIYDKSSFPIYMLAKFSLFGYPIVKTGNFSKTNERSTFCHDFSLRNENENKKYEKMIKDDALTNLEVNISLSFLYFYKAHELGHKNAPAYLYFLLKNDFIFDQFLLNIKTKIPYPEYLSELLIIGANRGSYISRLILTTETIFCYQQKNLSNLFKNFTKTFKNKDFIEYLTLRAASTSECHSCSEILNTVLLVGSEALMFLQEQGGESLSYPLFQTIFAEEENKINKKYTSELYSDEIYILENLAKNGNADAQLALGEAFFLGNPNYNVPRDLSQATNYFSQAAAQNNPRSLFNLGLMYSNGIGTEINGTEAKKKFEKAIELGLEDANSGLGYLYLKGIGVKKNITLSMKYFEKAANAGNVEAMANIGALYMDEKMDSKSAAKYFKIAAAKNHLSAIYNLGVLYLRGVNVNMTCEEVIWKVLEVCLRIDKLNLKEKALNKFKKGMILESFYLTLLGTTTGDLYHFENLEYLFSEFRFKEYLNHCKQSDHNLCRALFLYKGFLLNEYNEKLGVKLADLFYFGSEKLDKNFNLSFIFYEKVQNNSPEAKHSLSFMYENGYGVQKNITKSKIILENLKTMAWDQEIEFEHYWPALISGIKLDFKIYWEKWKKIFIND